MFLKHSSLLISMKKALVCGAGGFIGTHLVNRLKKEGYWVRGVDLKNPEFAPTQADEFFILDLRDYNNCKKSLTLAKGENFDEVYQLAADMGGMGFISTAECEIMRNSALININMIHAASEAAIKKYFFSSSVCVYRDMKPGEPELKEEDAYPASPDNEYGWEKLYSERIALTYGRNKGIDVKTARFENTYGPEGTWQGGREKAPAAMSRKIAEIQGSEGTIEVWGDGTAERIFTYIDDLIDGIRLLMDSEIKTSVNIGSSEKVNVHELVECIAKIASKKISIKYVPGPVGVQSRNFSKEKIKSLGWSSKYSLEDGMRITYKWIEEQVKKAKQA